MLTYLSRVFWARKWSLFWVIVAAAITLACVSVCLVFSSTLSNGHPQGSHFEGQPLSLLPYVSSMQISFSFDPAQIQLLKQEIGDAAVLVASVGARPVKASADGHDYDVGVDVVDNAFFDSLGIRFVHGSDDDFDGDEPVCVIAEHWLARYGLAKAPDYLLMGNQRFRVIGVVQHFKGVFDHESQVWVPWQQGHRFLRSGYEDGGLLSQPPFYWLLAIVDADKRSHVERVVQQVASRADFFLPPVDSVKIISGVTYDASLREEAETSVRLYLLLTLAMFCMAVLSIASWVALVRTDRMHNELSLVRIGMPWHMHLFYSCALVAIPMTGAFAVAQPLIRLIEQLLMHDPAVAEFLNTAAKVEKSSYFSFLCLNSLVMMSCAYGLAALIARLSGVRVFTNCKPFHPLAIRFVFRGVLIIASTTTTITIVVAITASAYSSRLLTSLTGDDSNGVWVAFHSPDGSSEKRQSDRDKQSVLLAITQQKPQVETALVSALPPFTKVMTQGFAIREGTSASVQVMVNNVSIGAFDLLGISLIEGRYFESQSTREVVADQALADRVKILQGKVSAVGVALYDEIGRAYEIVGVVSSRPYSVDPSSSTSVMYRSEFAAGVQPIVLLKGETSAESFDQIRRLLKNDFGLSYSEFEHYQTKLDNVAVRYKSRLTLCLIAAVIVAVVSLICLASIVNLELRQRRRTLAICFALGASPFSLWWFAVRGLLIALLLGTAIGLLALTHFRYQVNLFFPSDLDWLPTLMVSACGILLLGSGCLTLAFYQHLTRRAPADFLRVD